jgi:general secretion pathway protein G
VRGAFYILLAASLFVAWQVVRPRFGGHPQNSPIAAAQIQISNFKTALDAFEEDNRYYPNGTNGLLKLLRKPVGATNWCGPYIQAEMVPKDPWGNDYLYEFPGKHNPGSYDLSSKGPPGDDLVIANWPQQRR